MKRTDFLAVRSKCKEILEKAFTPSVWQPETSYSPEALVKPTEDNGHFYRCVVAGSSGPNEPDWPTSFFETVEDGNIVWREEEPVYVLDYEEDLKYPSVVVGNVRPVSEIQIALGNKVACELRVDIFITSYIKNKSWQQMRQQAFDVCSQVQRVIRENPSLENFPGVMYGKSGVYTFVDSLPCFFKLNLIWFVDWKEGG